MDYKENILKRSLETNPINQQQPTLEVAFTYKDTVRAVRQSVEERSEPFGSNNKSSAVNKDNNHNGMNNTELENDHNHDNIVADEVDCLSLRTSNDHNTASGAIAINQQQHNVEDNTADHMIDQQDNNNQRTCQPQPKVVHVAGMNAFSARDGRVDNARPVRPEPAYLESSSELQLLQEVQTIIGSVTLEVEGFVPTVIEPHYLVPEENIQRIDHMYASVKPTNEHAPTSHEYNDREQHHRHRYFMEKYLNTICFVGVMIALIVSGIVVIAVCGTGICHPDSQESQNGQPYKSIYKSFESKQELMDAIDRFQSNQNVSSLEETYGIIGHWNVSQIQDFSYLFSPYKGQRLRTSLFNEDISRWDVSSGTNMSFMFYGAQDFRGDISRWDVSRVTDMQYFMAQAYKFDSNLSQWDTSQFVNTSHMFYSTTNFSGIGLENWTVCNVYDMTSMFQAKSECYGDWGSLGYYCKAFTKFNRNLSNWDVSSVHYMTSMFAWASSFQGVGIEDWDVSQVERMSGIFSFTNLSDTNLSKWNVSNVQDTSDMFKASNSFQGVGVENWDTGQVETMSYMFGSAISFDANLSKWNVSNVQDTSSMFDSALSFQGVGIEDWDTRKVETMSGMFWQASSFDANLSKWNISNVQNTLGMFYSASSFQGIGIEDWDTSKVETMIGMFYNASSFDANLSSWDVGNVGRMSYMFYGATSFRGLGLDVWNVSHVNNTEFMFESATAFHANLSNWDVSNVENATAMFRNATSFTGVPWWNETSETIIIDEIK